MRVRRSLLLPALLALFASWAWSQKARAFRVRSDLVLLDCIVTDQRGRFVADLRPDEIELREEGKRRPVEYFSLVQRRGRPAARSRGDASQRRRPPGPWSTSEHVHLIFFLDLNSMDVHSLGRVREAISGFLDSGVTRGDRFMLVTFGTSLRVVQPFTEDVKTFLRSLEAVSPYPSEPGKNHLLVFVENIERIFSLAETRNDLHGAVRAAAAQARNFLVSLAGQLSALTRGLTGLVRSMQRYPGKKRVLFFSEGYAITAREELVSLIERRASKITERFGRACTPGFLRPQILSVIGGATRRELGEYLEEVVGRANAARVSFYTVDARGLKAAAGAGEASLRGSPALLRRGLYTRTQLGNITLPQAYLYRLARGTGGDWFLNNNTWRGASRAPTAIPGSTT